MYFYFWYFKAHVQVWIEENNTHISTHTQRLKIQEETEPEKAEWRTNLLQLTENYLHDNLSIF